MNVTTIKKLGAPPIPDIKKRKHGYVLNLASTDKNAIEQIAKERQMKPAEIIHNAARLFIESGSMQKVVLPKGQDKPEMASCFLNLSALERADIASFTKKKFMTIADFFRTAVKVYIEKAGYKSTPTG